MADLGERAGMRDELLDREIFYSLEEVRVMVENWRVHYNTVRPHSALGYARQHPRPSRRQPGCSTLLRSASHLSWPQRTTCSNIPTGPPIGGWPLGPGSSEAGESAGSRRRAPGL